MNGDDREFARRLAEGQKFADRTDACTAILNALVPYNERERRLILTAVSVFQVLQAFEPADRAEILRTVTAGAGIS